MPHRLSLSRRTFLRGTGAAIALPWLEAMQPRLSRTALAAAAAEKLPPNHPDATTPPVRMACIFFPNGVWRDAWIPKKSGTDYELTPSLEPLAKVRQHVGVYSGLDKATSRGGDGHYAKTANFLTGLTVVKTTGKDISVGGASIDQVAADKIGGLTPLPSLELGIDPVISGIDSNVGYTRLYGSYISWRSAKEPVAKEINPRFVFDRLFGDKNAAGKPAAAARDRDDDRSLLDLAMEDAAALRRQLGRDDQFKLDEYLESVRAVEKRIEFASRPDRRKWTPPTKPGQLTPPPPGVPEEFREHVKLMLDLLVLAFQTDNTRVASMMFANDVSGRNFSFLDGVRGGHHDISHHSGNKDKIEMYRRINRWHVEQFVYVVEKMAAISEGESTLLDNSMVLFGSSMSDGNSHDPNNLPILVGGRAGGSLPTGQHFASPANTPLCNLYVSMLDRVGAPVEAFGDSTGKLESLEKAG